MYEKTGPVILAWMLRAADASTLGTLWAERAAQH